MTIYRTAQQIRLAVEERLGKELSEDMWDKFYDFLWHRALHEPITDADMDEYVMPSINFILMMRNKPLGSIFKKG